MNPGAQGQISVSPSTASPGSTVQVSGPPGGTVFVHTPGSGTNPKPVTLDKNGKADVEVPDEGEDAIVISDFKFPRPSWVRVTIVQPHGPLSQNNP